MRQLTNNAGEVTYAKSYDPYGVVAQVSGEGQSAYGYTGESQDVASGMVYLRSRYYNVADGRFQSRDTWGGSTNQPMSFNLWNYVQSNPVNYTDPAGHERCSNDINSRVAFAKKYVNRTHAGHLIRDEINTYTAGGVGVQCYGTNWNLDPHNSGEGIAQISDNQIKTPYGEMVEGDRGTGLLCYIVRKAIGDIKNVTSCICKSYDEMVNEYGEGNFELEDDHDQKDPVWAVIYMRRRIQQVADACDNQCTSTDKFIVAALAQNGPGLTHFDLTQTVLNKKPADIRDLYRYLTPDGKVDLNRPDGITVDWSKYFKVRNNPKDTYEQLNLFAQVVFDLHVNHSQSLSWYVPADLNWNVIWNLTTP